MTSPEQSKPGRKLATIGAWLQIGPPLGMVGTIFGMVQAFDALGQSGIGDPARLSKSIGWVLCTSATGWGLGIIGVILLCIAAFGYGYRTAWMFWIFVVYSTLLFFHPPYGSIIAAFLMFFTLRSARSFLFPEVPIRQKSPFDSEDPTDPPPTA